MKKTCLAVLMLLLPTVASAYEDKTEIKIGGINYRLTSDGKAEIAQNSECRGDIIIPDSITYHKNTYQVTTIACFAFSESGVTSVTLPDAITTISSSAFNKCQNLKRIRFPRQLAVIESGGFFMCESLDSVVCPPGLKEIHGDAFWRCSSLNYLVLNDSIKVIKGSAFFGCNKIESLILPATLTDLDGYAFVDCLGLRYIDCRMANPPTMRENGFANAMRYFGTILVPSASRNAYRHATGWKEFRNIVEDNDGREMVDIHIRCDDKGSVLADGKRVKGTEKNTADLWFETERGSELELQFIPEIGLHYDGSETEVTRLVINSDSISPFAIRDNTYVISQIQDNLDIDVTFDIKPRTLFLCQADGGSIGVRFKWDEYVGMYILPNQDAEVESASYDNMPLYYWDVWCYKGDNFYNFIPMFHDTTMDIRYKKKEDQP